MAKGREIDLSNLPRWTEGRYKGTINWKETPKSKVSFIYDDIIGELEIIDYLKDEKRILVKYNDRESKIDIFNFTKCGLKNVLGIKTKDFKVEIGQVFKDTKRDFVIIDREYRPIERINKKSGNKVTYNLKWYKYKCNKCPHEDWIEEAHLLGRNGGCNSCAGKVAVLNFNTIWDTNRDWIEKFGVSEEDAKTHTRGTQQKIVVKCPDCGQEKETEVRKLLSDNSIGCSCSDGWSYPNKFIHSFLTQLGVNFVREYGPDYLVPENGGRRKRSDFYLSDYKIVIEADGRLGHEGGVLHSKSDKTMEELIAIDRWKDEQHMKNGNKVIRIDCFKSDKDYIRNSLLNSELNNIFNLSNINWETCEEYAFKNIAKEVCEYWNNKQEWENTTHLCEVFNISDNAIREYLKRGADLGLCFYDPNEELRKSVAKNGRSKGKRVAVYKDGEFLGEFNSAREIELKSEELFGIKLFGSAIRRVCTGELKQQKGFTFREVNEDGSYEKMIENLSKPLASCKEIEMYKDGVSLGVFQSATKLEEISMDRFGVQLDHRGISEVCNGKAKTHKGYTFRFTNDKESYEMMMRNLNKPHKCCKKVLVYKDNEFVGEFESATEIERCSLELFGVKLHHSAIALVCNGKQKQHKGYVFYHSDSITHQQAS